MCFLISIQIQRLWLWFSLHPKMILKYNWLGGLKKFLGLWNMGSVDLPFLGWKFLVWTFLEIFSFCLQTLLCHFHIKTSWTGANHMQMTRMSIRLSLLAELSWFCFQANKERMIWESSSGASEVFWVLFTLMEPFLGLMIWFHLHLPFTFISEYLLDIASLPL